MDSILETAFPPNNPNTYLGNGETQSNRVSSCKRFILMGGELTNDPLVSGLELLRKRDRALTSNPLIKFPYCQSLKNNNNLCQNLFRV